MRFAKILLALAFLLFASFANATPRIGVVTFGPGDVFFERFGHDALVVLDEDTGVATDYNFGFFDPDEPGFVGNFARGRMMYQLVALPFDEDMGYYRDVGRSVTIQWLDLRPEQARKLADALAVNALPQNQRYRYDYFRNNCASRVRDAVDDALGGALKNQLAGRSRGNTYRSESVRLASPAWWMWLGFDIGLGPFADTQLSRWDEAFIPMRLQESLREAKNSDGRALVAQEVQVLPQRIAPEPKEQPRHWWPWLLAGIVIAALILVFGAKHLRALGAFAFALWLACGALGSVLLFLWLGSEHVAAWRNQNLLLLDPLCLLLLPAAWSLLRGKAAGAFARKLALLVAALGFVAWFLHWLPFAFPFQDNRAWVALLLPVHAALARVLARR